MDNFILQEDNASMFDLEDNSGLILLENSTSGTLTYTVNNPVMVIT